MVIIIFNKELIKFFSFNLVCDFCVCVINVVLFIFGVVCMNVCCYLVNWLFVLNLFILLFY